MSAESFSVLLKKKREQSGLSQKELAEKSSLSIRAIGHYEQGLRKPSLESAVKLAEALGVDVLALVPSSGEVRPVDNKAPTATKPKIGRPKKRKGSK